MLRKGYRQQGLRFRLSDRECLFLLYKKIVQTTSVVSQSPIMTPITPSQPSTHLRARHGGVQVIGLHGMPFFTCFLMCRCVTITTDTCDSSPAQTHNLHHGRRNSQQADPRFFGINTSQQEATQGGQAICERQDITFIGSEAESQGCCGIVEPSGERLRQLHDPVRSSCFFFLYK
jgi:hypothetical protein